MGKCPQCSAEVASLDRFCSQCGLPIEHVVPEKEHRLITVVFSDLCGYSGLSERLDPEDLKTLIDTVLSESTRIVTQHGGVVEKYIGDAAMAMFGLDQTREDDPVRAIRAAVRIHKSISEIDRFSGFGDIGQLMMHTGINSGEVLYDRSLSAQSPHGPLGKPISIASRLSDMANPGEILIGESVVTHAVRYFNIEWAGRKIPKGFRSPIHVHRILSERKTPLYLHRDGGAVSPMVGRDHELSILSGKLKDLSAGHGNIVCITGEAGVGKSRLIQEFKASLQNDITFITALCFDHAKDTPYFPVSEIIRQVLNVELSHIDPHVLSYKLEKLGIAPANREFLSFLCGCPLPHETLTPDEHKSKVSEAVASLISIVTKIRPVIFCIEDIHWADQSSLDLLGYIGHVWKTSFSSMLIVTRRQGMQSDIPGMHIRLQELPETQIARMLKLMLNVRKVPDTTVRFLYEATAGNPFYLEEVVNYLLDKGVDFGKPPEGRLWKDLPATLHGLIGSRIDSVTPQSRRILQEASLIGRTFSLDLLCAVSSAPDEAESTLHDLMRHGFICCLEDHEHIFKHDLTREVASRALLREDRISIHRNIALELEKIPFSSGRESPDKIAYHFEEAQEYAKAIEYRMKAAHRYQETGSWVEASVHYQAVQRSLRIHQESEGSGERLREVWEGIWMCSRIFNPTAAIEALESLVSHYRGAQLKKEEAYACIRLINLYSQKGLFNKALQLFDYSSHLIDDDRMLLAASRTAVAYTYTFLGKPLLALEMLELARPTLESSDRFLLAVNRLTTLAACVWKGDIPEAHLWYTKTKDLTEGYMDLDLMAEIWLAHICCLEGSFGEARKVYREVLDSEKKLGSLAGSLSYLRIQGSIYFRSRYLGDICGAYHDLKIFDALDLDMHGSTALAKLYQAWITLEEGRASLTKGLIESSLPELYKGIANRVPYALNALAEAYLLIGEPTEARKTVLKCIQWNEDNGNQDQLIWALKIWAQISSVAGELETARIALKRSFHLARTLGMKPHMAWIMAAWGNVMLKSGKFKKAQACFHRALVLWEEMDNQHQVFKIRNILKSLET